MTAKHEPLVTWPAASEAGNCFPQPYKHGTGRFGLRDTVHRSQFFQKHTTYSPELFQAGSVPTQIHVLVQETRVEFNVAMGTRFLLHEQTTHCKVPSATAFLLMLRESACLNHVVTVWTQNLTTVTTVTPRFEAHSQLHRSMHR
jgi:hypothetical protein